MPATRKLEGSRQEERPEPPAPAKPEGEHKIRDTMADVAEKQELPPAGDAAVAPPAVPEDVAAMFDLKKKKKKSKKVKKEVRTELSYLS